jgi:hypothetical protein
MVLPFEKSFASHPKAIYWSNKNEKKPEEIKISSGKKFWFDCVDCGHKIEKDLSSIVRGEWCPYCSKPCKKLCDNVECTFCFNKSFASQGKAKYWSNKNDISPREIFKGSSNKYWFNCINCNHNFNCKLNEILKERWCPYCSKPCQKLCKNKDCTFCFNNSFASHEKSQFWSNKNDISPRYITKSSSKQYLFDCNICNHTFKSAISDISSGYWCGYCVNHKFCNNEECTFCFNNSFASHEKSPYWSDINNKKPEKVALNSHKKYWFDCVDCDHSFESIISNIAKGSWCPFCSNKKLCDNEQCTFCFNNSFASQEKSQFWSDKNTIKPRQIFKCARNKYWFNCKECNNSFESEIRSIKNGSWCPICKNKTEKKLHKWLSERYTTNHQCRYDWCKNSKTNKHLPYDFEIESNIIIELDGNQHFKQIMNWNSPLLQKERDLYKIQCAFKNGKHIIRIFQEDVWNDKNEWDKKLIHAINSLKIENTPSMSLIGIEEGHFINDT